MGAAGRMVLVLASLLVLLTYLSLRGATPDTVLNEGRLAALDALILNDAGLQRDLLKARAGLLRDYDPLVSDVEGLREASTSLETGRGVGAVAGSHLERLAAEVNEQEVLVDEFKSNNALLQNSLAYFAHVSCRLARLASAQDSTTGEAVGELANGMLRFLAAPSDGEAAASVSRSLGGLARRPVSPTMREDTRALVAHGRLILKTLPVVDNVLARLLATRITERAGVIQDLVADDYRRAESRARIFRVLLYLAAVLLVLYLGRLYLRLRASARALAEKAALEARLQRRAGTGGTPHQLAAI